MSLALGAGMHTRLLVVAALLAGGCATAEESELLGGTEVYRIHEVTLPRTFDDVRRVAFDLDQNGTLDNAAGTTLMSFFMNFDGAGDLLPELVNQALADERVSWYIAVKRDVAAGRAEVMAVYGTDADAGDAVPGTLFADVIGDWPVTWMATTGIAGEVAADGASLSGRLGFALPQSALHALAEPMARYFTEKLQAGELVMTALMDADEDGVITVDEFLDHQLVKQLLAPDVDLLAADGHLDSWSAAFDIHGVAAGLDVPGDDTVD
jgi:hypothetical protein